MKALYLILSLVFFSFSANAKEISGDYINSSILRAAEEVGIPPALLWAVCYSESGLKAAAYVHNDGLQDNSAFGVCQVLYHTAVELGMKPDLKCLKDFRTFDEKLSGGSLPEDDKTLERSYKTCKLFGPYTNAYYAAKYLKKQIDRYNGSEISGIAAYNTGSLKVCKTGKVYRATDRKVLYKCQKGGLLNQKYVDRVLKGMQKYPYLDESEDSGK